MTILYLIVSVIIIIKNIDKIPFILLEIVLKSLPTHSSPFTFVIISPANMPACSAGEFSIGFNTTMVCFSLSTNIYIPIPT